jgi:hypothetical protein
MLLLACSGGCFFEEHDGRHHGREAVVVPSHVHCVGCGHVQVRGVWYIQN